MRLETLPLKGLPRLLAHANRNHYASGSSRSIPPVFVIPRDNVIVNAFAACVELLYW